MKKVFSNKGVLAYIVINFSIAILSLFLLFAKVWEASFVLFVSSVILFFYYLIMAFYGKEQGSKTSVDSIKGAVVSTILRVFIEVLALVVSALGIYFIPSLKSTNGFEKLRFLYLLLNLVPYTSCIVIFYISSKKEE